MGYMLLGAVIMLVGVFIGAAIVMATKGINAATLKDDNGDI